MYYNFTLIILYYFINNLPPPREHPLVHTKLGASPSLAPSHALPDGGTVGGELGQAPDHAQEGGQDDEAGPGELGTIPEESAGVGVHQETVSCVIFLFVFLLDLAKLLQADRCIKDIIYYP